jgi:hypothetical protein
MMDADQQDADRQAVIDRQADRRAAAVKQAATLFAGVLATILAVLQIADPNAGTGILWAVLIAATVGLVATLFYRAVTRDSTRIVNVAVAVIAVAILVSLAGVSGFRVTRESSVTVTDTSGAAGATAGAPPATVASTPTRVSGPVGGGVPTTSGSDPEVTGQQDISQPGTPITATSPPPRPSTRPPSLPPSPSGRFHSRLRPDCPKAVVDLDFDRYADESSSVKVGLHADGFGTDFWKGHGTLWPFLYQDGVGWFPTPQPAQRRGGQWLSENLTFGRDRAAFPADADDVQRQVYLTLADGSAVAAIRDFVRTSFGSPMEGGLPTGARLVAKVDTLRIC